MEMLRSGWRCTDKLTEVRVCDCLSVTLLMEKTKQKNSALWSAIFWCFVACHHCIISSAGLFFSSVTSARLPAWSRLHQHLCCWQSLLTSKMAPATVTAQSIVLLQYCYDITTYSAVSSWHYNVALLSLSLLFCSCPPWQLFFSGLDHRHQTWILSVAADPSPQFIL